MSVLSSRVPAAVAAALCMAAGTLGLAACGSDSNSNTAPQTSTPVPQTATQTTTKPTTSTTSSTTTEDNGGSAAPSGGGGNTSSGSGGGGGGGSTVPDTPSHDVVPPANTPQGKFEQYCNQNPGACG